MVQETSDLNACKRCGNFKAARTDYCPQCSAKYNPELANSVKLLLKQIYLYHGMLGGLVVLDFFRPSYVFRKLGPFAGQIAIVLFFVLGLYVFITIFGLATDLVKEGQKRIGIYLVVYCSFGLVAGLLLEKMSRSLIGIPLTASSLFHTAMCGFTLLALLIDVIQEFIKSKTP